MSDLRGGQQGDFQPGDRQPDGLNFGGLNFGGQNYGDGQREPLHQPPDPDLLRARPPRNPACAVVRGLLRDSADGDLEAADQRVVDEHVHGCRECGIALSQAEHEVLRLRRAFAREDVAAVPVGFARRVVDRLVLDETSLLPREQLLRGSVVPGSVVPSSVVPGHVSGQRTDRAAGGGDGMAVRRPAARRWRWFAVLYSAALLMLLLALGVGYEWLWGESRPVAHARLVITAAAETYSDDGTRLERGDGLGDAQSLWVGSSGLARAEWHDASAKRQPAATFEITNRGEVRVQDGTTVLVQGNLLVESRRPLSIPVADGSRLDLGIGEYLIGVDDLRPDRGRNLLGATPEDLRVSIEVRRGDAAQVVRGARGATLIDVGQLGVYRGGSAVDLVAVSASGGEALGAGRRREPVENPETRQALLSGVVVDRAGLAVGGADVLVSFGSQGLQRMLATGTAAAGSFFVETGVVGSPSACGAAFAIVQVLAPTGRQDLGFGLPDVHSLVHRDGHARLAEPVVLDATVPVFGSVADEDGGALGGVRVVPCVVDELFAAVLVWSAGQVLTGPAGEFVVRRLPGQLPRHQRLALLLYHEQFEPAVLPVPERGTNILAPGGARGVLRALRTVPLVGLPANSALTVFEDVPGFPPGVAAVRRPVAADASGSATLSVGGGRLWLRNSSPTQPMLRELVRDGTVADAPYRPQGGSPRLLGSVFQAQQPLLGTELLIASSSRFQRFRTASSAPSAGVVLAVQDAFGGRSGIGAQVFAVRAGPVRDLGVQRFLGLVPSSGSMLLDCEPGEYGVVVLAADGSLAGCELTAAGDGMDLQLAECGRILLDAALRNPTGAAVAVQLERLDPPLRGLQPTLVRFTGPLQSWEIAGVPPGHYLVQVAGRTWQIEVPAGGQLLLR